MPLDPQAQDLLDRAIRSNTPAYETLTPAEARILYDKASEKLQGPSPALFKTEVLQMQQSSVVLKAKLYHPSNAAKLPALVYFHGGGFVFGSLQSHDAACAKLCQEADCLVIAVDYRLAPEYPFPTAVDDAWLAQNLPLFLALFPCLRITQGETKGLRRIEKATDIFVRGLLDLLASGGGYYRA